MAKLTRESIKQTLTRRYSPRLHMSLILASCGLAAMITSWSLLHLGVGSMLVRYPIAISLAYVTFLLGVWTWLRAMGYIDGSGRSTRSSLSGSDSIDIPVSGGSSGGGGGASLGIPRGAGGAFDGGGASTAWAENQAVPMAVMSDPGNVNAGAASTPTLGGSKGGGGGGFSIDGLDGDGLVVILLAVALVAIVFVTSGYLIWCAPDVLTEAAFGAALAGTLTRSARKQAPNGWVEGVVKKTWWPFAVVLVAAMVFGGYVHQHFPQASTFRQAITLAVMK